MDIKEIVGEMNLTLRSEKEICGIWEKYAILL